MIKALATFTKFSPKFDEVFSIIYAQFIVEDMERQLKSPHGASWIGINLFADPDFWYKFLELSVQTYGRLVDEGKIMEPPASVLQSLEKLNDAQATYHYPSRKDFRSAKRGGQPLAKSVVTLKAYREAKKIAMIRSTEEDAKNVLKEMVKDELNYIGKILVENMKTFNLEPDVTDLGYYFMTNFCAGTTNLSLDKEIKEEVADMPSEGHGHYTYGGELSTPDGNEYIGYYHITSDDAGNSIYMVGEYHVDEEHEELTLFANKVIVPIGDLEDYGYAATYNESKPFVLEKIHEDKWS